MALSSGPTKRAAPRGPRRRPLGGRRLSTRPLPDTPTHTRLFELTGRRIALLSGRAARQFARLGHLTPARSEILRLAYAGPVAQALVVEELGVTAPVVSRMLAALEDAGLIERYRAQEDRRRGVLVLTKLGREAIGLIYDHALYLEFGGVFGDAESFSFDVARGVFEKGPLAQPRASPTPPSSTPPADLVDAAAWLEWRPPDPQLQLLRARLRIRRANFYEYFG